MLQRFTEATLAAAARLLRDGGVLAYPTEAVFGLGCDPHQPQAVARIFALKQRDSAQGVLLVASDFEQLRRYIDMAAVPDQRLRAVQETWPGPHTWVFPRASDVPAWVAGEHAGIALRVTDHAPTVALCRAFAGALVSTSANPHGELPARSADQVADYFGDALDGLLDAPLGGSVKPSGIRDALSGAMIRA